MVRVTSNRLARAWSRRQHVVQVFETDLPGPRTTLYLLGSRVVEPVPIERAWDALRAGRAPGARDG